MDIGDVLLGTFIGVLIGGVVLAISAISYDAGKSSVADTCRYDDHFIVDHQAFSCHPMKPL